MHRAERDEEIRRQIYLDLCDGGARCGSRIAQQFTPTLAASRLEHMRGRRFLLGEHAASVRHDEAAVEPFLHLHLAPGVAASAEPGWSG